MSRESRKKSRRKVSSISLHEQFLTDSPEETRKAGEKLARSFVPGDIVFLAGELGSGKTTLVQGMAKGLGVAGQIRSSSFILVNEYTGNIGKVYHMDLYRLAQDETESLGLDEYMESNAVCIIEWAERLAGRRGTPAWEISLRWIDENTREVNVIRHPGQSNTPVRKERIAGP